MHTTGGYLTQASYTHHNVFDVKPETDVYWCTADIGWVTGHTYIVYGPLSNGVTQVVYEGTPASPNEHRHFEVIEKYGVTIYYTAPTLIRTFMKWGREIPDAHDLSSLRLLGSVGEPINPEAWRWYRDAFGGNRTPIVDTWWQTETGSIMISPLPGVTASQARFRDDAAAGHLGEDRRRRRQRARARRRRRPSTSPATWCSTSRGRRCCAASGATRSGTRRPTGHGIAEQGWYFAGDGARVRRRRQHLGARPHRRRDERVRTPDLDRRRWSRRWSATPASPRRPSSARTDETTGQAHLRVRHPRSRTPSDKRRDMVDELRAQVAKEIGRSPGRARSTSFRSCRRRAAARSCAGCCATSPRGASSATRRHWWIPACSRRSGPASNGAGSDPPIGDEAGARPVLGGDVGQHGVDRHRVTAGVCSGMNLTMQVGRSSVNAPWIMPDQPVVDRHGRARVARLAAHLVDDGARVLAGAPRHAARVAGGAAQLARDVDRRVGSGPRPSIWNPLTLLTGLHLLPGRTG